MLGWDKSFTDFTAKLANGVRQLPGMDAQYKMVPPTRQRPNLEQIRREKNPRLAGVLALFYPKGDKTYLVLMKRNTYPGVHSGQISFPGGQKEVADKTLVDTALREAEEEVGVNKADIQVLGSLSEVYIPPSNFLVEPVLAISYTRPIFQPDPKEVHSVIEVPFEVFLRPDQPRQTHVEARGFKMEVPSYHVNNEVVWGATAMMISEITHIFKR